MRSVLETVSQPPLNPASATRSTNDQIDTIAARRVKQKSHRIVHPIKNSNISYAPSSDVVTITSAGKETFPTGGSITVLVGLTGASGVPVAGSRAFTMSNGGIKEAVSIADAPANGVTPEGVERYRDAPSLVICPALREGRVVYGRKRLPPDDPREWLDRARIHSRPPRNEAQEIPDARAQHSKSVL